MTPEAMSIRARSPIRRSPASSAPCDPEATVSATPSDSQATSVDSAGSASITRAIQLLASQKSKDPISARPSVPHNSVRRVRPTASFLPSARASAICLVPVVPVPTAAIAAAARIRLR